MNQLQTIDQVRAVVQSTSTDFEAIAKIHGAVNYKREASFAMQLLSSNTYLASVAIKNQNSLKSAVLNIASIGLSLNPAHKHAYLVPRDGRVCLDIGYMGMIHLACDVGSIKWAQAEIVRKADKFAFNGVGEKPTHDMQPFEERGEIVGAYVVVKTYDNEYLTTIMSIKDIYSIRDRSPAWKSKKSGPWKTDEGEMIKKTVIKRAAKTWPMTDKSERLSEAIETSNQTDPIDLEGECKPVDLEAKKAAAMLRVEKLLLDIEKGEMRLMTHLSVKYKREITALDDLTHEEAEYSANFLASFEGQ